MKGQESKSKECVSEEESKVELCQIYKHSIRAMPQKLNF